uniref:Uncharacterized protein n=1 Tax=Physcomitrium patens TaxID=3218 RepID=A0A2K1J3P2_PHYPA|nr:hypothetical protein PHYPA_021992 [Physcomitrium patens]
MEGSFHRWTPLSLAWRQSCQIQRCLLLLSCLQEGTLTIYGLRCTPQTELSLSTHLQTSSNSTRPSLPSRRSLCLELKVRTPPVCSLNRASSPELHTLTAPFYDSSQHALHDFELQFRHRT